MCPILRAGEMIDAEEAMCVYLTKRSCTKQTPGMRGVPRGPRYVSQQPRDTRAMQGYPGAIKSRGGDAIFPLAKARTKWLSYRAPMRLDVDGC